MCVCVCAFTKNFLLMKCESDGYDITVEYRIMLIHPKRSLFFILKDLSHWLSQAEFSPHNDFNLAQGPWRSQAKNALNLNGLEVASRILMQHECARRAWQGDWWQKRSGNCVLFLAAATHQVQSCCFYTATESTWTVDVVHTCVSSSKTTLCPINDHCCRGEGNDANLLLVPNAAFCWRWSLPTHVSSCGRQQRVSRKTTTHSQMIV